METHRFFGLSQTRRTFPPAADSEFLRISRCIARSSSVCRARCMECGVPFCQSGVMMNGMVSGCPLHNLIPETNDLVYRGKWEQAYRLNQTHRLPEHITVCPALCRPPAPAVCMTGCALKGKRTAND